ncbi:hypothetical protein AN641_10315 [Candidatus Epulonipiscioides gigas]|nr:hypothetical protein AN641_10315 [Epulopiscium sp. SCG-C07WGA-EpuloA2]
MLKSKSVHGVCWRATIMLYLIIHISLNVSMSLDFSILGGLDMYIISIASAIIISILLCKKILNLCKTSVIIKKNFTLL